MISIIVHSGEWDKIYHAFSMASTYSAIGKKVKVFITYWAIDTIAKGKIECGSSEKNEIIQTGIESGKVKSLEEMIKLGKEFDNVEVIVCSGSMELLGYSEKNIPEWIDRIGGLAEQLMEGEKVIFI